MKYLAHILLAMMSAMLVLTCEKDALSEAEAFEGLAMHECVCQSDYSEGEAACFREVGHGIENKEGDIPSPCQFAAEESQPSSNADDATSRRVRALLQQGVMLHLACGRVRSLIHPSSGGGFMPCTTSPVYSLASRVYYIYVLRHIIR